LLALLASLREEVRGRGVRVNAILPDVIDTPANRRAMPGADFARWTRPEDIARVVAFLLSDAGRAVHGAEIPVAVP
ncbi:MAG: SDR family oxidoreductase, partial [Anaeromyxobacteraceae bacterium]